MVTTWIAMVGSVDQSRSQELALRNPDRACAVTERIGHALAERGLGLVVYSSETSFVERFAVAGYVKNEKAQVKGIRVIFPRDLSVARPSFPEQAARPECFDLRISPNTRWEMSFYESLIEVSAVILVGGGRSTFVAGIMGRILKKTVLPLDAFGGAGSDVWSLIDPAQDALTEEDRRTLAEDDSSPEWALSIIDIATTSLQRRTQQLNEQQAREVGQRRAVAQDAVFALTVFVLSCVLIVFTWDNTGLSRTAMMSCLVASPILAGFSGAFIRKVADAFQTLPFDRTRVSWLSLGALGGIAGGFSGLLFVMAQLTATPTAVGNVLPVQVSRLVPFAMITGFLAGFTADLVYSKLRETRNLEGEVVPEVLKAAVSAKPPGGK